MKIEGTKELAEALRELGKALEVLGRKYGPPSPKTIYRTTDRPKTRYTSAEEGEGSDLYRSSQFAEASIKRKVAEALRKLRAKKNSDVTIAQEPEKRERTRKPVTFSGELPEQPKKKPVVSWETKTSSKEALIGRIINAGLRKKVFTSAEIGEQKNVLATYTEPELERIANFIENIEETDSKIEIPNHGTEIDLTDLFMDGIR
uniref:Uncharacterized protein n=1 Tax=Fervidicoccus fontis TaxID=683846 RepID=A0A7J3SM17_9CREN